MAGAAVHSMTSTNLCETQSGISLDDAPLSTMLKKRKRPNKAKEIKTCDKVAKKKTPSNDSRTSKLEASFNASEIKKLKQLLANQEKALAEEKKLPAKREKIPLVPRVVTHEEVQTYFCSLTHEKLKTWMTVLKRRNYFLAAARYLIANYAVLVCKPPVTTGVRELIGVSIETAEGDEYCHLWEIARNGDDIQHCGFNWRLDRSLDYQPLTLKNNLLLCAKIDRQLQRPLLKRN